MGLSNTCIIVDPRATNAHGRQEANQSNTSLTYVGRGLRSQVHKQKLLMSNRPGLLRPDRRLGRNWNGADDDSDDDSDEYFLTHFLVCKKNIIVWNASLCPGQNY